MPRYFFHVRDGTSTADETGTELPDIRAAQAQATRLGGEILQEMGAGFSIGTAWTLEVADEDDRILFVLRFAADDGTDHRDSRGGPRGI